MMQRFSIRTKMVVLIIVVTTFILAAILAAISQSLHREMERKVVADFNKTQYFFKRQEALIYDRLVESCLLIGQNAAFKANVALGDPASVAQAVDEFAGFTKSDLMVVTGNDGRVLSWLDRPEVRGRDIGGWPGMAAALEGQEPEWTLDRAVLWAIGQDLYQVVTTPVRAGGIQLGTITMGILFTDYEASFLKGNSAIEISMFLGDRLVGSSIDTARMPDREAQLKSFLRQYDGNIAGALAEGRAGEVFSASFGGTEVFAFVSALGAGADGYYLAFAEKANELLLLRQLSRRIFLIGLGGFAVAILLAFLVGSRFSRPIRALAAAMERVKTGDLDQVLPIRSGDEVGKLTETFNAMMKAMKERLYLMKYVGGHTLRMIRSEDTGWFTSRGRRMEVAVLFSDIRGFTAYSELNEPEQVIEMLNAWLGFQGEEVRRADGFVDKYVGDEMVALFTGEDALGRAFACACRIQEHAARLAGRQAEPIAVGIGLNHGPVVMGNIGNDSRMDYTVIGNSVNLGARLCASAGPGEILLTAEAAGVLNLDVTGQEKEMLLFKGLSRTVEVVRWKGAVKKTEELKNRGM